MDQRINLVTLGAEDVMASAAFYERLGWRRSNQSNPPDIVFFQAGGIILALFGRAALAADAGISVEGTGFRGVAVAINMASKAEVDAALADARNAGGKIVKPARDVFWGGYSGYFADPDDHLWEVAWNPHWPIGPGGMVNLPD